MSIKQMAKVWEYEFSPNHQLIMLALADHADDSGGSIFPSVARLAWKTGYTERNVQRILSELRESKVIQIIRESTQNRPNEYKINWKYATKKEKFNRGDKLSPPDSGFTPGVTAASPEPSFNHHIEEDVKQSFQAYEATGRLLVPLLADEIKAELKDWYDHAAKLDDGHINKKTSAGDAMQKAIELAVTSEADKIWPYAKVVFRSWMKYGYGYSKPGKNGKKQEPDMEQYSPERVEANKKAWREAVEKMEKQHG